MFACLFVCFLYIPRFFTERAGRLRVTHVLTEEQSIWSHLDCQTQMFWCYRTCAIVSRRKMGSRLRWSLPSQHASGTLWCWCCQPWPDRLPSCFQGYPRCQSDQRLTVKVLRHALRFLGSISVTRSKRLSSKKKMFVFFSWYGNTE